MKPGLYVATVRGVRSVKVWSCGDDDVLVVDVNHEDVGDWLSLFTDARPLVVLDPESDEDAAVVADLLGTPGSHAVARSILRALAAPTPAEPMGLGAVVLFDDGRLATRSEVKADFPWSIQDQTGNYSWSFLSANNTIEILSEGWSA